MKKLLLLFCIISVALIPSFAQNIKADKGAVALAQFEKALTTIESKDFVITVDPSLNLYGGGSEPSYVTTFLSYEEDSLIVQGIIPGRDLQKLKVSEYNQVTDKKGNVKISMHVLGFFLNGKIDISLKKTEGNVAYIIITPYNRQGNRRFWGRVLPRSEANFYKLPGEF